jgi:hypothetical protein
MLGTTPSSGVVRVTAAGMRWLRRAAAEPTHQGLSRPLTVRAGVVFDVLDLPRQTGEAVFAWLCAHRRPIGPIAFDADVTATRWLIHLAHEAGQQSQRPDLVLPPEPGLRLHLAGATVRLPAQVTAADARLRWVVRPHGSEHPLTSVADLAEALAEVRSARHVRGGGWRNAAQRRQPPSAQPPQSLSLWVETVSGRA